MILVVPVVVRFSFYSPPPLSFPSLSGWFGRVCYPRVCFSLSLSLSVSSQARAWLRTGRRHCRLVPMSFRPLSLDDRAFCALRNFRRVLLPVVPEPRVGSAQSHKPPLPRRRPSSPSTFFSLSRTQPLSHSLVLLQSAPLYVSPLSPRRAFSECR